jgi:branched-chain amino acid transport system permease protein
MTGSIVAAPILSALPQLISYVFPEFASYRMLIYAIVLVVVMIFKPSGLFGGKEFSLPNLLLDRNYRKKKALVDESKA